MVLVVVVGGTCYLLFGMAGVCVVVDAVAVGVGVDATY